MIVVLLPNGGSNYRWISLLEPPWKVLEAQIVKQLAVIPYHDCIHGFIGGRGTGTATIETKLVQQLAYLEQALLYGIFLDLIKAYSAIHWDRCFLVLKGYGVEPNMLRLIKHVWDEAVLVFRASGYYRCPFKAQYGATQGSPVSPSIFNMMDDVIVRAWFRQVLIWKPASFGYGEAV